MEYNLKRKRPRGTPASVQPANPASTSSGTPAAPAALAPALPELPITPSPPKNSSRRRIWLRRLTALLFWGTLVALFVDLPLLPPPTTRGLITLALLLIVLAFASFESLLGALGYVATFPIWGPLGLVGGAISGAFRVLKAPWRTVLLIAPRVSRFYRSPWIAMAHVGLAAALDFAIYVTDSPVKLRFFALTLLVVTLNTVLLTFFVPPSLQVSQTLLLFVRRHAVRKRLLGSMVSRRLRIWPDPEEVEKAKGFLDLLGRGRDWLNVFTQRLTSRRAVVLSFLIQLIVALLVVAANFGFIYYAAARLDARFFGCTTQAVTLAQASFFSFTTITTAGGSPLCANTAATMGLSVAEIFCGLLLLSVAGLGFTTLYPTDTRAIRRDLAAVLAQCDKEIADLAAILALAEGLAAMGKIPSHDLVVARASGDKTLSEAWAELIEEISK